MATANAVLGDVKKIYADGPNMNGGFNACYYGLPYQDHNYGAPPPLSPAPKVNGHIDIENVSSTTEVVTSETSIEKEEQAQSTDDSITRCICNFQHDDGYMICCDTCSVWQHVDCMGIDRTDIPENYLCEICQPRTVHREKARKLQIRRRHLIKSQMETSSTDTDEESQEMIHGKKEKRQMKKRFKKASNTVQSASKKASNKAVFKAQDSIKNLRSQKRPIKRSIIKDCMNATNKVYQEASSNNYNSDVQKILARQNCTSISSNSAAVARLSSRLCKVVKLSNNKMCLTTSEIIPENQPIIEYIGKVMLRNQYDKENRHSLRNNHPYTLFYEKFAGIKLCIDSSDYGNNSRFVRRSCQANAEIHHILTNGKPRFYIFSSQTIEKGEEVTIPFSFSYQNGNTKLDCACSSTNCLINKIVLNDSFDRKQRLRNCTMRNERVECARKSSDLLESVKQDVGKRKKSNRLSNSCPSEDSAEEVEETILSKKKIPSKSDCDDKSSFSEQSDDESGLLRSPVSEGQKKMSREEKKMEAIMKAFAKLEKREERSKKAQKLPNTPKKEKLEEGPVKTEEPNKPVCESIEEKEEIMKEECEEKKEEEIVEEKDDRPGKRMGRRNQLGRRRCRLNSGTSSTASATDGSADEAVIIPSEINSVSNDSSSPKFKFPQRKRYLLNEWRQSPSSAKADDEDDFVVYMPSPHGNSLSHLRRNGVGKVSASAPCTPTSVDSSVGSAKKRWLRQAMTESNDHDDSPSNVDSPSDFVTPLKKRRLARSSMSVDETANFPQFQENASIVPMPDNSPVFVEEKVVDKPTSQNNEEQIEISDVVDESSLPKVSYGMHSPDQKGGSFSPAEQESSNPSAAVSPDESLFSAEIKSQLEAVLNTDSSIKKLSQLECGPEDVGNVQLNTTDDCKSCGSSDENSLLTSTVQIDNEEHQPCNIKQIASMPSSNNQESECLSDSASSLLSSSKKKVSLLEYRQRRKSKPMERDADEKQNIQIAASITVETHPSLPQLPLFENSMDNYWSSTATSLERAQESPQMSLTERLKQEFGLDTSESDEAPPPPPPPPPPNHTHLLDCKKHKLKGIIHSSYSTANASRPSSNAKSSHNSSTNTKSYVHSGHNRHKNHHHYSHSGNLRYSSIS